MIEGEGESELDFFENVGHGVVETRFFEVLCLSLRWRVPLFENTGVKSVAKASVNI